MRAISIYIDNKLIDMFLSKLLTEEFIRKLYLIMNEKDNPSEFIHKNQVPFDKNVIVYLEKDLFKEKIILADKNSLEMEDIIEKAAIGFTFAFFLNLRPSITEIEVLLRGDGYDYKWKENGLNIKLEISGVNKENTQTFNKRIYEKRKKFNNRTFRSSSNEELICIVDFCHLRYKLWNTR